MDRKLNELIKAVGGDGKKGTIRNTKFRENINTK